MMVNYGKRGWELVDADQQIANVVNGKAAVRLAVSSLWLLEGTYPSEAKKMLVGKRLV